MNIYRFCSTAGGLFGNGSLDSFGLGGDDLSGGETAGLQKRLLLPTSADLLSLFGSPDGVSPVILLTPAAEEDAESSVGREQPNGGSSRSHAAAEACAAAHAPMRLVWSITQHDDGRVSLALRSELRFVNRSAFDLELRCSTADAPLKQMPPPNGSDPRVVSSPVEDPSASHTAVAKNKAVWGAGVSCFQRRVQVRPLGIRSHISSSAARGERWGWSGALVLPSPDAIALALAAGSVDGRTRPAGSGGGGAIDEALTASVGSSLQQVRSCEFFFMRVCN